MGTISQKQVALFVMPDGRVKGQGTSLRPLSITNHAMTGRSIGSIPTRGQDYGYDVYGRIIIKRSFDEPPGGLSSATIEFDKGVSIDFMEQRLADQGIFSLWEGSSPCGRRDDAYGWLRGGRLDYLGGCKVTGFTPGDAPSRTGEDVTVVNSATFDYDVDLTLLPLAVRDITPQLATNIGNLLSVWGLEDPLVAGCAPGYLGPDKHLFAGGIPNAAASPLVYFSENGGGLWAAITAAPFAADDTIVAGGSRLSAGSTYRLVAFNGIANAAGAQSAYADPTFGDVAAATWTISQITTTASDLVTGADWLLNDGYYAGVGQAGAYLISVSEDRGVTWSSVWSGSDAPLVFAKGYGQDCEDIYAAGENGLFMIDVARQGAFAGLVPPTGGADITAIAIDTLGYIYVGAGSELWVSIDGGQSAGNWTLLADFGGAEIVQEIFIKKGDGHHLYVMTDDTTPGSGKWYQTNDAGSQFVELTALSNQGYNAAYESSQDHNRYICVGDVNGTYGAVHLVTPSSSGC